MVHGSRKLQVQNTPKWRPSSESGSNKVIVVVDETDDLSPHRKSTHYLLTLCRRQTFSILNVQRRMLSTGMCCFLLYEFGETVNDAINKVC